MIMKNIDVVNCLNGLFELSNVSFPVQLTYAIKKNHRKLVTEYGEEVKHGQHNRCNKRIQNST